MELDEIKAIIIGTVITMLGGILKILISIQNKEHKRPWEHLISLTIVIVVGLLTSYILYSASWHEKWYSAGVLFIVGYLYRSILDMLDKKVPFWFKKLIEGYIKKKYNLKIEDDEEDKTEN